MSAASHLHDALNKEHIDICGISEHWLFEENRHLFQSIHRDYDAFVISDFSLHPCAERRSRKGGVAILWHRRLSGRVTVVESDDDRIAIIKLITNNGVFFLIQVYLPTSRYGIDIFTDYVDRLDDLCTSFSLEGSVVLMGDFNARLSGPRIPLYQNSRGRLLQRCIDRHQLCALTTTDICVGPLHSYVHSEDGSSSLIDHIIVNSLNVDLVRSCDVLDHDFLDVSNHRPLLAELRIPHSTQNETCETISWISYRWVPAGDSKNVDVYRDNLDVSIINSALWNTQELCSKDDVDIFTRGLMNCIRLTSDRVLPKRKFCKFLKPYWNGQLKELHRNTWRLRQVWVSEGRPRGSNTRSFRLYKDSKRLFRNKHRQISEKHIVDLNDEIEKCADVDQKSFWSLINKRRKSSAGTVGADMNFNEVTIRDPALLALHWGNYFEDIYSKSNCNNFDSRFEKRVNESIVSSLCCDIDDNFEEFSLTDIKNVCKSLPCGKAAGYDPIVYEHLLYAPDTLY
ncbi:uncharacterized protein LOC132555135 [Ylistrum balloti]|uniref:uncharacterized protein LOC132555135 n=1 Tax=Ylistrum balloti TaxID=509963 RepID=UPI002905EC5E|nr:uncharacterized protein LOC132555135 [Ylistrum balloti]